MVKRPPLEQARAVGGQWEAWGPIEFPLGTAFAFSACYLWRMQCSWHAPVMTSNPETPVRERVCVNQTLRATLGWFELRLAFPT